MISLRNFALRRGERLLLSNVDLALHAGYRVGVVGRNGTGKSSLFAAIKGELEADKGTYTVADVFNYTFNFETAGEIAGQPDWASATTSGIGVNVPYAATVQAMGSDLVIDVQLAGTASIAQ